MILTVSQKGVFVFFVVRVFQAKKPVLQKVWKQTE